MAPSGLPLALADTHRTLALGATVEMTFVLGAGSAAGRDERALVARIVEGGGFASVVAHEHALGDDLVEHVVSAVRLRTLPDYVAPHMRVLMCGLNPSIYAADAGVGFARPGNRFWPAAIAAGLATRDRAPRHFLRVDGIGMTDLVKRATARADEVSTDEFRAGVQRVTELCEWLRPAVLCVVGLTGWRQVVDRKAVAGVQPARLGGVPVYVMPNPSGINAHAQVPQLADHLRAAAALADSWRAG
jgi:TDG/mug DNA glycosylase family protein